MNEHIVKPLSKGVHNKLDPEDIPKVALQDAQNYVTKDGRAVLVGGRKLIGASGDAGKITGQFFGYKVDGTKVHYRKAGTAIQYYDGSAWQDCITGLSENDDYYFANYSSLAGAFTFINGPAAYYKIINAVPNSPINIYDSSKNFYGRILIDKGRTILWYRDKDKTGLYGSKIDRQNSTVYTSVSGEAIGSSGSTNYTGTLAFKAGGAKRNCFGVSFSATVAAGTELFTDNYDGTLTSNYGGTGTINYATGEYDITFSDTTTGAVTSNYQYEDSTNGSLADFTYSATRQAGEGFQFPQDEGGDAILNVLIGQDGNYYSLKEQSTYRLSIDTDDLGATNEVFRKDIGIPFHRAAVATSRGIVFMNTANPSEPTMTILQRNQYGTEIEPVVLFPHFDFSKFNYNDSFFGTYDRWILVFCKSSGADANDRILMCDIKGKTVDIVKYTGRTSVQDAGNLYVGDSITKSVYQIFNGFDDLDNVIDNFLITKKETYSKEFLKKYRQQRVKGRISSTQKVEVYADFDGSGYGLVGTILGSGSYVNQESATEIGSNFIGDMQIGADNTTTIKDYHIPIKIKTPKFRARTLKFVAIGFGYFDINMTDDWDILKFEHRMPKAKRIKQNVSLDGTETDQ